MNNRKTYDRIVASFLILSVLAIVFAGGVGIGQRTDISLLTPGGSGVPDGKVTNINQLPEFLDNDVDFAEFWDVWQYIEQNYVDPKVPQTQLFYGALAGLVASLGDPYSVFLNPEVNEKFSEELSGNFEGIGAEIGIRNDQLAIIAPLAGTPADRAGLKAGDLILAIDGQSTVGISLDVAVNNIRGKKGTTVVLSILNAGADAPRDISIVRDTIEIDSVRLVDRDGQPVDSGPRLLEGDIAYLELLYFNENTLADWNRTVQDIVAANPKGIILDLRNNPGGFLETAIEVSGEWVNGNTVVSERFRDGSLLEHKARRTARFADIPTVVLINGGSASGAEIVAGALQDYGKATLVGEKTFGKGSVQDLRQFGDGSSVKLTIAEWLTPNGRNINKQGIEPDVAVELTPEDVDAGKDPQLDKALEILGK